MGKQKSKWTFLVLQYLGLGAKKLGRLLSARATISWHQGKAKARARTRTLQSTMVFFAVTFCFTFSGMASTPDNNTEDALFELSPIGAQAAPDDDDLVKLSPISAQADLDDDDVQIVGAPQAIEKRNPKSARAMMVGSALPSPRSQRSTLPSLIPT